MTALGTLCIHGLPSQSHPEYSNFFHSSLASLGVDARRSGLLQARRGTRIKVAAWLGRDEVYRQFLRSYRGKLLALIQPVDPQALKWLPLTVGLMLSEGFIDFHQGWFALSAGADGRIPARLVRAIELWRQVNPRSTLSGRTPAMTQRDIENFGLSLVLTAARTEHALMPALVGFKFRPALVAPLLADPPAVRLEPHEQPLVHRAVAGFLRFPSTL